MRVARALLLSSKKQAEAWEYRRQSGILVSDYKLYRFLAIAEDRGLRFQMYRVSYQRAGKPLAHGATVFPSDREVLAGAAHVDEWFPDLGALHTFLHRAQIDIYNFEPVE
jgi:hypothetical protein